MALNLGGFDVERALGGTWDEATRTMLVDRRSSSRVPSGTRQCLGVANQGHVDVGQILQLEDIEGTADMGADADSW